jgi:hypothetical protein
MAFDFSDHIVLSVVQYILPCMLEVHYSLVLMSRTALSSDRAVPGIRPPSSEAVYQLRLPVLPWLHLPALIAAAAIIFLSLRSMLLTCMFFHTFAENAVGFCIAATVAFLPFLVGSKPAAHVWLTNIINVQ